MCAIAKASCLLPLIFERVKDFNTSKCAKVKSVDKTFSIQFEKHETEWIMMAPVEVENDSTFDFGDMWNMGNDLNLKTLSVKHIELMHNWMASAAAFQGYTLTYDMSSDGYQSTRIVPV